MFPMRRRALSVALLVGVMAIPVIAGPASATDVQRYKLDFPPVGFTWSFFCGTDEVDGTITVNNEYETDFLEPDGSFKFIIAGQLFADLYAPSTGQTYTVNISGPGVIVLDASGENFLKYMVLGPAIGFGSHYVHFGFLDFATGDQHGVRIDLCPKVGLSA